MAKPASDDPLPLDWRKLTPRQLDALLEDEDRLAEFLASLPMPEVLKLMEKALSNPDVDEDAKTTIEALLSKLKKGGDDAESEHREAVD